MFFMIANTFYKEISIAQIHYPQKPPIQPPKPTHLSGNNRDLPGLWMTHDPAIFYDDKSSNCYIYSTGAICKRSKDLLHWESLGKVGSEYCLYCSNSS